MASVERYPGVESLPEVDRTSGVPEPVFAVDVSAVRTVADLLELLGDLPSTPEMLAAVSTARAGDLTRLLPAGGGMTMQGHGSVDLSASLVASVAGLLQHLGGLNSTPPVVADDAASWAGQLWERLEEPEHPAGHRPGA